ncbi:MAG TPA: ATP-binding cassette domain-containing protein [Pseudomonadales bacterium]|nr:ATP-binding cassette domain-containing protein [Pseudomonadales bacterium]
MIQLQNVTLARGAKRLFENANFTAHAGWHIGLVGENGCGKSSLFALLCGNMHADQGDVSLPRQWRIAHMAQEVTALDRTALQFVLDGDQEWCEIQAELMQADPDRIAHLHERLHAIDGYTAESRAAKLLWGLGFTTAQQQKKVGEFSGGWRMRLNLAQTLMCRSDLMLLDEPTNHLDLDAILWLEDWLRQYPGTLIVISHDREFLDGVVQHILHIEHGQLNYYSGNYSAFELLRAERLAQQKAQYDKQQAQIAHMEKYIARFRAQATKARQAQSRIKALERMQLITPAHSDSPFHFQFKEIGKASDPLLRLDHADLGYADQSILKDVNFVVRTDSRIGLLGPNGAGKSTLLKALVGDLALHKGSRSSGEHTRLGYFSQHQLEQLDFSATPLLHMQRLAPTTPELELRSFLGGFGFIGEQALEPVARFSGGEKARLVLAMLVWQRPNVLVLDEPTNHLDLEMRHALSMALQEFEGGVVVVSHDRHLLRVSAEELVLVAEGQVQPFNGDLDEYADWLNKFRAKQQQADSAPTTGPKLDKKAERKKEADIRAALRPLTQALEKLETRMTKLQQQLNAIEQELADPSVYEASNKNKLTPLLKQQADWSSELAALEMEWLETSEAKDEMQKQLTAS